MRASRRRLRRGGAAAGAGGGPPPPAAGGGGCTASMTVPASDLGFSLARYASPRLVRKNTVASAAVTRDRKFAEPVAPNRLEEEPPPKPEPMSAPLPCWSSTRPMMASAISTCATMIKVVHCPMSSAFPFRLFADGDEVLRLQRRAADQPALPAGHGDHGAGALGVLE